MAEIIGEHRLLLAVINQAVLDATDAPVKDDVTLSWRPSKVAYSAIEFLYGEGLEVYCRYLDLDPGWMRKKLQDIQSPMHKKFSGAEKRYFGKNRDLFYKWKGHEYYREE